MSYTKSSLTPDKHGHYKGAIGTPGANPTGQSGKVHIPSHGMLGANAGTKGGKRAKNRIAQALRRKK
ncbi:MAG: hypothetical protein KGJ89_04980 [Patescibacteria group bacterium]|nr:hypothetical protein [Patescibacteria group bacterium]MDE2227275.1 hypothetical protein [Patescibacteria group bacterium]